MNNGLLIGIDGGATHSTAVAAWPDGQVAAVAYGEGLNFNNVGFETVRQRIESIVCELQNKTGAIVECACIGSAALDFPADDATTAQFTGLLNASQIDLQSDAYVALMGLTRGQPGMIAICGTGSMLLLSDKDGRQHISGGWGYLMEDAGSGYCIAREGLLAAIDAYEGVGEATTLTAHALEYFGISDLRDMIVKIYDSAFTPDQMAGFARYVISEADSGDAASAKIIGRTMEKLAAQAHALFQKAPGVTRIGLYGGIFAHSQLAQEKFSRALINLMPDAEICNPEYPPELGAIIHLMHKRGILTEKALENLKDTYERVRK
ncbi:MAG: hypothetical protein IJC56_00680 [Clostridia bacterium]|nr:hypothetical protein [Clostridia bacterium]